MRPTTFLASLCLLALTACSVAPAFIPPPTARPPATATLIPTPSPTVAPSPTDYSPPLSPTPLPPTPTATFVLPTPEPPTATPTPLGLGQYLTQGGDTVENLAVRFRTGAWHILDHNPDLPRGSFLAPGLVLEMPFPDASGFAERLLPDSELVYSPAARAFDVQAFVQSQPGWLATYTETPEDPAVPHEGWAMVEFQARQFSINPRLLLALLEYNSGALTNPTPDYHAQQYPLGMDAPILPPGLEHQLGWAGNMLDTGYYGWRAGRPPQVFFANGAFRRLDGSLNAGTFGLLYLLSQVYNRSAFDKAIGPEGVMATYWRLFGDPWVYALDPIIPGGLTQPELQLPFEPGVKWQYTSGPHAGWGYSLPYSAIDFAPPASEPGCAASSEWAVAVHAGIVTRSELGLVELDLGGGWSFVYLHLATPERVEVGAVLNAGDRVGHPSCEGGHASAVHIHIARKYQGEWIPADGLVPLVLSGWRASNGEQRYQGALTKGDKTVTACACGGLGTLVWIEP